MTWFEQMQLGFYILWYRTWQFGIDVLDYIERYPGMSFIFAVAVLSVLLSMHAVWRAKRNEAKVRQRLLLRGSKMNKRARAKWLDNYGIDRWVDILEAGEDKGEISESEKYHLYRKVARSFNRSEDLKKRKIDSGLLPPKKVTSIFNNYPKDDNERKAHLAVVKNALIRRMKWAVRRVLNKPVNIPGDKPPKGIQVVYREKETASQPTVKTRVKGFLKHVTPKFSTNAS